MSRFLLQQLTSQSQPDSSNNNQEIFTISDEGIGLTASLKVGDTDTDGIELRPLGQAAGLPAGQVTELPLCEACKALHLQLSPKSGEGAHDAQ